MEAGKGTWVVLVVADLNRTVPVPTLTGSLVPPVVRRRMGPALVRIAILVVWLGSDELTDGNFSSLWQESCKNQDKSLQECRIQKIK